MTGLKLEKNKSFTISQSEATFSMSWDLEEYSYDNDWPCYMDFLSNQTITCSTKKKHL